jgi:hypothetical protein
MASQNSSSWVLKEGWGGCSWHGPHLAFREESCIYSSVKSLAIGGITGLLFFSSLSDRWLCDTGHHLVMIEARVFSGTWLQSCLILLAYQLKAQGRREALAKCLRTSV